MIETDEIRDLLRLKVGADILHEALRNSGLLEKLGVPKDPNEFIREYEDDIRRCAEMETELGLEICILEVLPYPWELHPEDAPKVWEAFKKQAKETREMIRHVYMSK